MKRLPSRMAETIGAFIVPGLWVFQSLAHQRDDTDTPVMIPH
jgi:hypothetical protein